MKLFINYAKGSGKNIPAAKKILIKKNGKLTKFKIRTSKYLMTLKVDDLEKAKLITNSIPASLTKVDLDQKKEKKSKE